MAVRSTSHARRLRRPRSVTPARWVAWNVVRRTFDEGAYTERAFDAEAERAGLEARERAFAQHLAYGTVQRAKTLDHVIGVVGRRPLRKIDSPVLHALRLGAYQLLYSTGTAPHAAVDQSVELVRGVVGERAVAFANAVLRRAQVDGRDLLDAVGTRSVEDLAVRLSYPDWIVRELRAAFHASGIEALELQNEPPSVVAVRVNPLRVDVPALDETMQDTAVAWRQPDEPWASAVPEARVLEGSSAPLQHLFAAGAVHPQSLSSSLVARVVDPQPGERVLDLCAAPGGKTAHMAALMRDDGAIFACDVHGHRADDVAALAQTAGATIVRSFAADGTTLAPTTMLPGVEGDELGTFDRVLVDAPCTGTGVLGRRPDARWKRDETDLDDLVELQRALLRAAVGVLRPGGRLVYSTCSLLPQENEQIVQWALAELELDAEPFDDDDPAAAFVVSSGSLHLLRTWPDAAGSDGFFVGRVRKTDRA